MSCNSMIILGAGSLEKEVITLQSKDQDEAVYYEFSLENRIGNQTLENISWAANVDNININNITIDGQIFKCLISGGTVYTNIGISFKASTTDGEIRTFNCVLPIRPEGVMEASPSNTVIFLGNGQNNISGTGLPEGSLIHDGMIISPDQIGVLPSDLILNGNLYTAPGAYLDGTKQLPSGLFLNSNIVMTDGSVFFPHTINNNGVLCAA